jgi:hypothetical protein
MKTVLIIFTFFVTLATQAKVAERSSSELLKEGYKMIQVLSERGELTPLINVIVCEDRQSKEIVLFYTKDFREFDRAYLINQGQVAEVNSSKLGLVEHEYRQSEGNYETFVTMGDVSLRCVTSSEVLE